MAAIVNSVAELGIGDYDGQLKIIQYGPSDNPSRAGMRWHVTSGLWISEPRNTFTMRDTWPGTSFAAVPNTWTYFTSPEGNVGEIGQSSYGWNPIAIHHVDSAFAAGLKFQENILATWWTFDAAHVIELATVFFEIDTGDSISNLISLTAGSNLGTVISSTPTRRILQSTGWVDSAKQSSTKPLFTPHLYSRYAPGNNTLSFLEHLKAQWRWVGDPTP